jgi:hypothetical protein
MDARSTKQARSMSGLRESSSRAYCHEGIVHAFIV